MMGQAMNCKGEDRMDKNRKNGIAVVADSTLAAAVAGGNRSCVGVFSGQSTTEMFDKQAKRKHRIRRTSGGGQGVFLRAMDTYPVALGTGAEAGAGAYAGG
jgi:hypothetical protein